MRPVPILRGCVDNLEKFGLGRGIGMHLKRLVGREGLEPSTNGLKVAERPALFFNYQ